MLLAASLLGLPAAGTSQDTALPGDQLFLACAGCHSLDPEDASFVGPHLAGIVGRQAGGLADYVYSPALAEASFAWDRNVLFSWIVAAESLLPGTHMLYHNHLEADEVFRLIDYLAESGEPHATER